MGSELNSRVAESAVLLRQAREFLREVPPQLEAAVQAMQCAKQVLESTKEHYWSFRLALVVAAVDEAMLAVIAQHTELAISLLESVTHALQRRSIHDQRQLH